MSHNSPAPAGREPSKIWPSSPARLEPTRQNDTKGLVHDLIKSETEPWHM